MVDITANGQAGGQLNQPQLVLQKIYVKDVSFEAPNAPQIFQEIGEITEAPQVQLNLSQRATGLGNDLYEVVLTLTLTCTINERTAYLAEVQQAGLFGIAGFSEDDQAGIIGSYCPNLLYPYAAANVSQLIQAGGFPPFFMQPINFDGLYAENLRQRAAAQQQGALGDSETVGNA